METAGELTVEKLRNAFELLRTDPPKRRYVISPKDHKWLMKQGFTDAERIWWLEVLSRGDRTW